MRRVGEYIAATSLFTATAIGGAACSSELKPDGPRVEIVEDVEVFASPGYGDALTVVPAGKSAIAYCSDGAWVGLQDIQAINVSVSEGFASMYTRVDGVAHSNYDLPLRELNDLPDCDY